MFRPELYFVEFGPAVVAEIKRQYLKRGTLAHVLRLLEQPVPTVLEEQAAAVRDWVSQFGAIEFLNIASSDAGPGRGPSSGSSSGGGVAGARTYSTGSSGSSTARRTGSYQAPGPQAGGRPGIDPRAPTQSPEQSIQQLAATRYGTPPPEQVPPQYAAPRYATPSPDRPTPPGAMDPASTHAGHQRQALGPGDSQVRQVAPVAAAPSQFLLNALQSAPIQRPRPVAPAAPMGPPMPAQGPYPGIGTPAPDPQAAYAAQGYGYPVPQQAYPYPQGPGGTQPIAPPPPAYDPNVPWIATPTYNGPDRRVTAADRRVNVADRRKALEVVFKNRRYGGWDRRKAIRREEDRKKRGFN